MGSCLTSALEVSGARPQLGVPPSQLGVSMHVMPRTVGMMRVDVKKNSEVYGADAANPDFILGGHVAPPSEFNVLYSLIQRMEAEVQVCACVCVCMGGGRGGWLVNAARSRPTNFGRWAAATPTLQVVKPTASKFELARTQSISTKHADILERAR